ncbi:hypothetical protein MHBO_000121 [Bonamia ostreae]|uniref:Uncharacterized protein n=1 Tax=Bonamia ostreae TaxID=126728 RepID=A0ABV2AEH9_9EUKA
MFYAPNCKIKLRENYALTKKSKYVEERQLIIDHLELDDYSIVKECTIPPKFNNSDRIKITNCSLYSGKFISTCSFELKNGYEFIGKSRSKKVVVKCDDDYKKNDTKYLIHRSSIT